MRRLLLPFLCLGLIAVLCSAHAQEVLDGIAATVNKEVVTFSQVREITNPKEKKARENLKGMELVTKIKQMRTAAVSELVDRSLVLQEAKAQSLTIPESAIDKRIQSIIDTQFGGNRASFLKSITARGYTLASFRELQRDNLTVEKMRETATIGTRTPEEAKQREQKWLQALRQKAYIKFF
jgi:peptidyl-prolyl cis-trans isomerase SurA